MLRILMILPSMLCAFKCLPADVAHPLLMIVVTYMCMFSFTNILRANLNIHVCIIVSNVKQVMKVS